MDPGERVSLIHAITTTFMQNDDMSPQMIDVALDKFGADEDWQDPSPEQMLRR
jgi:hypothetical protein